jgi:hypothetical protein
MLRAVLCFCLVSVQPAPEAAPSWQEFNTLMMLATFRISGPAKGDPKTLTTGTAFLSGTPATQPGRSPYVLVTAAHVLERIEGDHADLVLRRERPDRGFERLDYRIQIRRQGADMYVRHPVADVAAMYVSMPDEATLTWIGPGAIGGDDVFERFNLHPGDELLAVGFPFGLEANPAGFPILRSGRIASYPLTPAAKIRTFLLDLHVYEGNSGAPVYLYDRTRVVRGVIQLGHEVHFVAGLIGQLSTVGDRSLDLAVIVPAQFIRETIARLPAGSRN